MVGDTRVSWLGKNALVWKLFAILISLVVAIPLTEAAQPITSVTGSGRVSEEGFSFWTTLAVQKDASGNVFGTTVVDVDLRIFGLGTLALTGQPNCLVVEGYTAWTGAVVVESSNEDLVPTGLVLITLVRDLGSQGQDIMHTELFDPGTSCTAMPPLPETVVASGDFRVS